MKAGIRTLLALLLFVAPAAAGQITLKNGDRITGTVLRSDGKTVTIKSEYAGEINVALSAVASIDSDETLAVSTPDGKVVMGAISTASGALTVRAADSRTVALPFASVAAMRSPADQAAFERRRDADFLDLWTGTLDSGFSLTRGNTDTTTFTTALNASRTTPRDKVTVYATSVYSKNSTSGASVTSANSVRSGGRYDLNVSPQVFAFGSLDLERDAFQSVDLRSVVGSGFGWHARKTQRTTLDVFGGATINRENFSVQDDRTSGEALVGQELSHKLTSRVSLKQRLALYPNLTDRGEFRLNVDTTAVTALNKWVGLQVTVSNRYVSGPVAPANNNDVLVTTGLRFSFAH